MPTVGANFKWVIAVYDELPTISFQQAIDSLPTENYEN
jgi:hypothetical protein